ncbi:helix-turn-helix transcriptional regulator [Angustibacter aerolatus]
MSRPTARVLTMLEILQRGGVHQVGDLAARLGVDERTVRRYVLHLLDLDVPVQSLRGRHGGYVIAPGYRVPPLMLTDDEALATVLGLVTRTSTEAVEAASAAGSALAKLRRVLPKQLLARLDDLLAVTVITDDAPLGLVPDAGVLLQLASAALDRHVVDLTYTDRRGERTARRLSPYGVVARGGRWYVTGADSASGALRTFRLDRVVRLRRTDLAFEPPRDLDVVAAVVDGLARAPWRHDVSVLVDGRLPDVRDRLPRDLATVDEVAPGRVRVRLRAERLDWVPAVLVGLRLPFVVESPDELRLELRRVSAALLAAAADPT